MTFARGRQRCAQIPACLQLAVVHQHLDLRRPHLLPQMTRVKEEVPT